MSAKKKTTSKPAAASGDLVTVEVINQPIYEEGAVREKGHIFQISARRADALRHFVKIVSTEEPDIQP